MLLSERVASRSCNVLSASNVLQFKVASRVRSLRLRARVSMRGGGGIAVVSVDGGATVIRTAMNSSSSIDEDDIVALDGKRGDCSSYQSTPN